MWKDFNKFKSIVKTLDNKQKFRLLEALDDKNIDEFLQILKSFGHELMGLRELYFCEDCGDRFLMNVLLNLNSEP